jgi:hypothetical protein
MVKYLDELEIYDATMILRIKTWLQEWIDEFKKRADGKEGTVRYCDFKKNDYFFYTDCQDLEQKVQNKEITQTECDAKERQRKREVYMQLFLKELISGKPTIFKQKDTHCGSENMEIFGLGLAGAVTYCPDCGRVVIDTTVSDINVAVEVLLKKLKERSSKL